VVAAGRPHVRHGRGVTVRVPAVVLADATRNPDPPADLAALAALIEDGRVTAAIDRTYQFDDLPAAVAYQETGHASGKVVVTA